MLDNLQVLRAFAALTVVLYHALATGSEYGHPAQLLRVFDGWGRNGVDIFFVISGFVMVYSQQRRPKAAPTFLWQRVLRIVPLYWLLTLLWYGMALALTGAFRRGVPALGQLLASLLFVMHTVYRDLPVVFVGWTLEYEMLFYLLFAIGIASGRRVTALLFTGGALLALVLMGQVRWIAMEFFLGMLCAGVFRLVRNPRLAGTLAVAGAAALTAPLVWPVHGEELLLSGLPACLLVTGLAAAPALRWQLGQYLGGASYSIYLVQVFSIPVAYKLITRFASRTPGDLAVVLASVGTVLAGCVLHEGVEKRLPQLANPFRRYTNSAGWSKPARCDSTRS